MKLKNKGGRWQLADTVWNMPVEGAEGSISDKNSTDVLGLKKSAANSGTTVKLQPRDTQKSSSQKWLIGEKDENGWFEIIHSHSGLILTAEGHNTENDPTITGKQNVVFLISALLHKYLNNMTQRFNELRHPGLVA